MKNKFKIGDKVKINDIKTEKNGKAGEVTGVYTNGAMIKLSENHYTPVKFEHLEITNG